MSSFQEKLEVAEVPLIGSGPRAKLKQLLVRWGIVDAAKIDTSSPPNLILVRQRASPPRSEYWWMIGNKDKADTMYECKEVKVDASKPD